MDGIDRSSLCKVDQHEVNTGTSDLHAVRVS